VESIYREKGMERFARRRTPTYDEIINGLARLIWIFAKNPPPPSSTPPDFRTLRNAFWDPPGAPGAAVSRARQSTLEAQAGTDVGPRKLLVIWFRENGPAGSAVVEDWRSASSILQEIAARRRLHFAEAWVRALRRRTLERIQRALEKATQDNAISLVIVP